MATVTFIGSVVALVVFYLVIVAVGIIGSVIFRRKHKLARTDMEFQIVAGRKLGSVVGWLTMSGEELLQL